MYNILVCDDEKDIVSALTIYLSAEGYRVYPAYSGRECLDTVSREDIHLVPLPFFFPHGTIDKIRVLQEVVCHGGNGTS